MSSLTAIGLTEPSSFLRAIKREVLSIDWPRAVAEVMEVQRMVRNLTTEGRCMALFSKGTVQPLTPGAVSIANVFNASLMHSSVMFFPC